MSRNRSFLVAIGIVVSLLGSLSASHPQAALAEALLPQDASCEYFSQTGHYVCGEFLEFFNQRGGIEIYGYPISEAFDDARLGLHVQYFQRARMELHPHKAIPYRVQLGLLVDELGYRFPPASSEQIPSFNSSVSHYFSETSHVVSYEFLSFFREKGGVDIFGYPTSEFMYENGYIVQYFQRARVEWHPETASGPRMELTNLGELYIQRFGVPKEFTAPQPAPFVSAATPVPTVTELGVSASVQSVVTGREGKQTVYVYVNDQLDQPLEGAAVSIVVHYQMGDQQYECEPTNDHGFTSKSFEIQPSSPGRRVVVDVSVTRDDLEAATQIFFLPWW